MPEVRLDWNDSIDWQRYHRDMVWRYNFLRWQGITPEAVTNTKEYADGTIGITYQDQLLDDAASNSHADTGGEDP